MEVMNVIISLIVLLAVAVVIFLILREFFCWYWKINEIVRILHRIDSKLSDNPPQNLK